MVKSSNGADAGNIHTVGDQYLKIGNIIAPKRGDFTPPGPRASLKGGA
jgi:hypothetical protein